MGKDRRARTVGLVMAALANGLPIAIFTLDGLRGHPAVFFCGAALGVVAPVAVTLLAERPTRLRWLLAMSGLPGLTLMQWGGGGIASPTAVLLVVPMLWFGLVGTRVELLSGLALTALCCFLPMLIVGPPAYPRTVAPATVLLLVCSGVALTLAYTRREVVRLTTQLRHDASHDRLTGLLNRRGWHEQAEGRLAGSTAVLIDLDRLKTINDTLGHDEGDRVLRETAERLRSGFPGAPVARLGGDEFAVLLNEPGLPDVFAAVDAVRALTPEDGGFSAGVAVVSDEEQLGDVLRRADLALYEAKTTGRGRTCLADEPIASLSEPPGHVAPGRGQPRGKVPRDSIS